MPYLNALDELSSLPDELGSRVGALKTNPPLSHETPDQYESRTANEAYDSLTRQNLADKAQASLTKQADATARRANTEMRAGLSSQNKAFWTDTSGQVRPITTDSGAPFDRYDKSGVVWNPETGEPSKLAFDSLNEPPSLTDPYAGAPVKTVGTSKMLAPAGVPWKYAGEDEDAAAEKAQKEQDKADKQARTEATADSNLARRGLTYYERKLRENDKQLAANGVPAELADTSPLDSLVAPPEVKKGLFGFGSETPESVAARKDAEAQKARLGEILKTRADLKAKRDAFQGEYEKTLHIPGLDADSGPDARNKTPDNLIPDAGNIPQDEGGDSLDAAIPGAGDVPLAGAASARSDAATGPSEPVIEAAPANVVSSLPPTAQQVAAPVKPDAAGQVAPEGFWATAGREFGTKILPGLGTAAGGLAAGAAAIETGPLAIAADIAGGTAGGLATAKAQRAVMGEQWANANDAQMQANAQAHPVAAQLGSMIPFLISLFGGGGAVVKAGEKVVGKAVTQAGKTAIEEALAKGAAYEAPVIERIATYAAMGARAGASEGAQEKYVEGKDVSVIDRAAKSALQFGATGLFPPAKALLGQVFGRAVTDAAAMTFAGDLYDTAIHGKPFDLEKTAKEFAGDVPAFVIQNALLGFLSHGMAALNRPGEKITVSDGVPDGSPQNVADELRNLRKSDPEKYKQRFKEEIVKRQQGEYPVTPPTMAERLSMIDIRLAQMRENPGINYGPEQAGLEAEKANLEKQVKPPGEEPPEEAGGAKPAPKPPETPPAAPVKAEPIPGISAEAPKQAKGQEQSTREREGGKSPEQPAAPKAEAQDEFPNSVGDSFKHPVVGKTVAFTKKLTISSKEHPATATIVKVTRGEDTRLGSQTVEVHFSDGSSTQRNAGPQSDGSFRPVDEGIAEAIKMNGKLSEETPEIELTAREKELAAMPEKHPMRPVVQGRINELKAVIAQQAPSSPASGQLPETPTPESSTALAGGSTEPNRNTIPVHPSQLQAGDRIFTTDRGYITVEKIHPFDPQFPRSQLVETSAGRRDYDPTAGPVYVERAEQKTAAQEADKAHVGKNFIGNAEAGEVVNGRKVLGNFSLKKDAVASVAQSGGKVEPYLNGKHKAGWVVIESESAPTELTPHQALLRVGEIQDETASLRKEQAALEKAHAHKGNPSKVSPNQEWSSEDRKRYNENAAILAERQKETDELMPLARKYLGGLNQARAESATEPDAGAEHVAKIAKAALALHSSELDALGHPREFASHTAGETESGIKTREETGRISLDPKQLAKVTARMTPRQRLKTVQRMVNQEIAHVAFLKWESLDPTGDRARQIAAWGAADDELGKFMAGDAKHGIPGAYAGWSKLGDRQKGHEKARVILEKKWAGRITEAAYQILKDFLKYLRTVWTKLTPEQREIVEGGEQMLMRHKSESERGPPAEAERPAPAKPEPPEPSTPRETALRELREKLGGGELAAAKPKGVMGRVYEAYHAEAERTGFPDVPIADVMEKAGINPKQAKALVMKMYREGEIESLSSADLSHDIESLRDNDARIARYNIAVPWMREPANMIRLANRGELGAANPLESVVFREIREGRDIAEVAREHGISEARAERIYDENRFGKPVAVQLGNAFLTDEPRGIWLGAANPLVAHHGTPHDVDKFSLEKVGTGEGAQVFGWGIYFAQEPEVAENYKRSTTRGSLRIDGRPWTNFGLTRKGEEYLGWVSAHANDGLSITDAIKQARTHFPINERQDFDKAISAIKDRMSVVNEGNTYTVHLDVEPDELLDWDRQLSEQSEKVKAALAHLSLNGLDSSIQAVKAGMRENLSGAEFYRRLSGALASDKAASEIMGRRIPGIRYLDQGSRVSPLEIEAARQSVESWRGKDRDQLRYAEQNLSDLLRKQAEGTHNYVIFDESKIKITHRNGEPVSIEEATTPPVERALAAAMPEKSAFARDMERQAKWLNGKAHALGYDGEDAVEQFSQDQPERFEDATKNWRERHSLTLGAAAPDADAADREKRLAAMEYAEALIDAGLTEPKDFAARVVSALGFKRPQSIGHLWTLAAMARPALDLPEVSREKWAELMGAGKPKDISSEVADALKTGSLDRRALTKLAEGSGLSPKEIDEAAELGIVMAGRAEVAKGGTPAEIFDRLVGLYNRQPNLTAKTSTSKVNQAYSTPQPLAYLASRLADIEHGSVILEPTAGNGALLIEAKPDTAENPSNVLANEIDPARRENLKRLGFSASADDATTLSLPKSVRIDREILNPPFGTIIENGVKKLWPLNENLDTENIDHAITLHSLAQMAPDGKAVVILGGKKGDDEMRKAGYGTRGQQLAFYHKLYSDFNVTDHFTINGDLYEKQGAGWPIDVIVIDGKGKSSLPLPSVSVPPMLNSWDELKAKIPNENAATTVSPGNPPEPHSGGGSSGPRGTRPGQLSGHATEPKPPGVTGIRQPAPASASGGGAGSAVVPGTSAGSGETPATGERTGTEGSGAGYTLPGGGERPEVVDTSDPDTAGSEFQAEYSTQSKSPLLNPALTPRNLKAPQEAAIKALIGRVGDIDVFALNNMPWLEGDMGLLMKVLDGGQVEAFALAIDNMNRGGALVVGDQTGMGKGRVAAAILTWAHTVKGWTPVFITEKPELYKAMMEDFHDINAGHMVPFITNSNMRFVTDQGKEYRGLGGEAHKRAQEDAITSGMLPHGANALFTTYAQIWSDVAPGFREDARSKYRRQRHRTPRPDGIRMRLLRSLQGRVAYVLDEAHNMTGDSDGNWRMMQLLGEDGSAASQPRGVYYSSATFAKRPDNMPLYFKTNMSRAVGSPRALKDIFESGGVPMQQVVSAMLAQDGQYLRREMNFAGITFNTTVRVESKDRDFKLADEFTAPLRDVVDFSGRFQSVLEAINQVLADNGVKLDTGETVAEELTGTDFADQIHNMVNQYLLAIKARSVGEAAVEQILAGKKPFITLENTMEGPMEDVARLGFPMDFQGLLHRYLERCLWVTRKMPDGSKRKERIDIEHIHNIPDLPPQAFALAQTLQAEFGRIKDMIYEADVKEIPISPIDTIRDVIEAAGYKVGEITGRKKGIKKGAVYSRPGRDLTTAGKNAALTGYNNGGIDALIANRSGASGISAHASPKFKDTRPRIMLTAQPNADIAVMMQMYGRTNRKGQIHKPEYDMRLTAIPAELRIAANNARKMAGLKANTTSNAKGTEVSTEAIDIFNDYGDQVTYSVLEQNPSLVRALRSTFPSGTLPNRYDDDGNDLIVNGGKFAKAVTGELGIAEIADQIRFYGDVIEEYKALISYLTDIGENKLVADHMDLAAETTAKDAIYTSAGESVFDGPAYVETVRTKPGKQPLPIEDVKALAAKNKPAATEAAAKWNDAATEFGHSELARLEAQFGSKEYWPTMRQATLDRVTSGKAAIRNGAEMIGKPVILTIDSVQHWGLVTDVRFDMAKPITPSKQMLEIHVNSGKQKIRLPMSQVGQRLTVADMGDFNDAYPNEANLTTQRHIVTGNLLAGFDTVKNQGVTGKIVTYTRADGSIAQGILLPQNYRPGEQMVAVNDGNELRAAIGHGNTVRSPGGLLIRNVNGELEVRVPSSRQRGGKFWREASFTGLLSGEMRQRGNEFLGILPVANMDGFVSWMQQNGEPLSYSAAPRTGGELHAAKPEDIEGEKNEITLEANKSETERGRAVLGHASPKQGIGIGKSGAGRGRIGPSQMLHAPAGDSTDIGGHGESGRALENARQISSHATIAYRDVAAALGSTVRVISDPRGAANHELGAGTWVGFDDSEGNPSIFIYPEAMGAVEPRLRDQYIRSTLGEELIHAAQYRALVPQAAKENISVNDLAHRIYTDAYRELSQSPDGRKLLIESANAYLIGRRESSAPITTIRDVNALAGTESGTRRLAMELARQAIQKRRDGTLTEETLLPTKSLVGWMKRTLGYLRQALAKSRTPSPILNEAIRQTEAVLNGENVDKAMEQWKSEQPREGGELHAANPASDEAARNRLAELRALAKTRRLSDDEQRERGALEDIVSKSPLSASATGSTTPERETTEKVRGMAPGPRRSPSAAIADALRTAGAGARTPMERVIAGARVAGNALANFFARLPEATDYKKLKGEWLGVGKLDEEKAMGRQKADHEAREMKRAIDAKFSKESQQAINIWREAGGDDTVLQDQLAALRAKNALTRGFAPIWERALKLTPEEKVMAGQAGDFYEQKAKDGDDYGLLDDFVENYVTHYWDQAPIGAKAKTAAKNRMMGAYSMARLKTKFDNALHRTFGDNFTGIMAGYKPASLKIGDVMSAYAQSFNHVVCDRVFVKNLATKGGGMASDGRPLGAVSGYAKPLPPGETPPDSILVKPFAKPLIRGKEGEKPIETNDYKSIDHPALRKHKWAGKDTAGNDIFLEGEILVHPEVYQDLKNTLGRSALAEIPGVKQVTQAQFAIKQTLLGMSGFHFVQEGTHALGHRVNPLAPKPIDWNDPLTQELVNNGLMLSGDWSAKSEFMEGLAGGGLIEKIPLIGPIQHWISDQMFTEYIPRLKNTMARDAFERNLKRFKKEVDSWKITREQVAQKTAQQANDAFGEQNYRYMGSNPTVTHLMRMTFLAWDFLRSRASFFADAFTKYGGEQRMALLLLGTTMFVAAKLIERMLTGENHWDRPFGVIYGGREYDLRSVPGDAMEAWEDPRRFIYGRLSPLVSRTTIEGITGRDYRGVKRNLGEQIQDLAKTPIPIPLRAWADRKDLNPVEGAISSLGSRVRRYSPITETKKLGIKWQEKNGIEGAGDVFPPSKYIPLKQALEDNEPDRARKAFSELAAKEGTQAVRQGFRASLMRPFSGSAANEPAFVASLSIGDRELYRKAVSLRTAMVSRFERAALGAPVHVPPKRPVKTGTYDSLLIPAR